MMITSTTSQDYPMFEYSTSQIHPSPFIMMERSSPIKWKPKNNIEIAPNCPRCASSNTKFCYYNNYSLSQPRYFCKACRRYWTKGGSLRNVPVGGGCRKTRRTRTAKPDGGPSYLGSTTLRSECVGPANSFSKYLERNVGNDDSSPGASIGSSYGRKTDTGSFVDGADDRLQSQVDDQFVYGHEDLACQNYNSFEMEGLFGGEFAGDHMLWAEGVNLPGFGDQESAALQNMQDFEMFSSDDQISVSGNLATTDNWSPFDLSGYEIFTRN